MKTEEEFQDSIHDRLQTETADLHLEADPVA